MIDEIDLGCTDPRSDTAESQAIAAIVAEFERIVGASVSSGPNASGVDWALPMASFDELLVFLREMPSDIGMKRFEAHLRDRSGARLTPDATPPGHRSEDGA